MTAEHIDTSGLWKEFSRTRSVDARNELMLAYTYLVKHIVYRMLPTYRNHVEYDDLMSCGVLGLIDAIDKFDIGKEVKFETYATLRIRGEIIDQIRKQDWAPNSLRQKIKKIEDAFLSIEAREGRAATEKEVSQLLNMDISDVQKVLDESHTFNILALDDVLVDRIKNEDLLSSDEDSPDKIFENKEMKETLAECIDKLGEKEKMVVSLYYFDELNFKEIGAVLGVSESRISQIHSKAIMSLRSKLNSKMR